MFSLVTPFRIDSINSNYLIVILPVYKSTTKENNPGFQLYTAPFDISNSIAPTIGKSKLSPDISVPSYVKARNTFNVY